MSFLSLSDVRVSSVAPVARQIDGLAAVNRAIRNVTPAGVRELTSSWGFGGAR